MHNHNDEPMFTADGVHAVEPYLAAWEPVLERHPDVLLYPTMAAGARGIPVQRRWAHVEELARRGMGGMTLVDPGSVNLGLTSDGDRRRGRRRGPVPELLRRPGVHVRAQRRAGGRAQHLGLRAGVPAHHADLAAAAARSPPGAMVKLYFGGELEFGLPPTATALEAYLEMLEPSGLPWSVAVLGGDVVACGLAEMRSAAAGTSGSGWRTTRGRASRPMSSCCGPRSRSSSASGAPPPRSREARAILGVPPRATQV